MNIHGAELLKEEVESLIEDGEAFLAKALFESGLTLENLTTVEVDSSGVRLH